MGKIEIIAAIFMVATVVFTIAVLAIPGVLIIMGIVISFKIMEYTDRDGKDGEA